MHFLQELVFGLRLVFAIELCADVKHLLAAYKVGLLEHSY
jgi:hypothetical protein